MSGSIFEVWLLCVSWFLTFEISVVYIVSTIDHAANLLGQTWDTDNRLRAAFRSE